MNFEILVSVPNMPPTTSGSSVTSLSSRTRMLLSTDPEEQHQKEACLLHKSQQALKTTQKELETSDLLGKDVGRKGRGQRLNNVSSSTPGIGVLYYCLPEDMSQLEKKVPATSTALSSWMLELY